MRCVTIREPWASAIFTSGKDIENRTRNLAGAHRGPLAIHVSQTYDGHYATGLVQKIDPTYRLDTRYLGYVIGVVDLVDVHRYPDCRDADGAHCSPWGDPINGIVHLVLANPRRLKYPMWIPGKLGLWQFPDAKLDGRWPDDDSEADRG